MRRYSRCWAVVAALVFGALIAGLSGCGGEDDAAEAQQMARINSTLTALAARLDVLERRVEVAIKERARPVERAPLEAADEALPALTVVIEPGRLLADGAELSTSALQERVAAHVAAAASAPVMVHAEPNVAHARVVEIFDLIRAAGAKRVSLNTTLTSDGGDGD